MAFKYEIKINGLVEPNIAIGFMTVRDWEEAYDSGKLSIVFNESSKPIMPLSYLTINVSEYDDYKPNSTLKDEKKFEFLVLSDQVERVSKLEEYYKHDLSVIEYTYKFESYFKNEFSFTRSIRTQLSAPFEYVRSDRHILVSGGSNNYFSTSSKSLYIPPIKTDIKATYFEGDTISFEQVNKGLYAYYQVEGGESECDVFLRINAPIQNNSVILSNESVNWTLPIGNWTIEYGLNVPTTASPNPSEVGEKLLYKFYINVIDKATESIFDLIEIVKNTISKFGGIESKYYFESTRLFELSESDAEYLKTIQAPQIYLQTATVKQILQFILSYVNALPRVRKGLELDILELEYYNINGDRFDLENINEIGSEQNSNQIGTSSYSDLKNVLPNDLNEPTLVLPSPSSFVNVRGGQIQMTDNNFVLPLVKNSPLYKPIKLEVEFNVYITTYHNDEPIRKTKRILFDITELWINKNEWDLKNITTNFPDIYFSQAYSSEVGLARYKTENLYWQEGDTEIKLSDVDGVMFQSNRIKSVLNYKVRKYFTEKYDAVPFYSEQYQGYNLDYTVEMPQFDTSDWYKYLWFRVSYITSETLSIKEDKDDLSQIDFYSEMRNNQDESTINLMRASRKIYGNLQRTGNVNQSFMKVHTSLSGWYKVGDMDINGNTITKVTTTWFNEHVVNVYSMTKNHNRIAQATFVDQTYRWRDNYAQQLIDRHENYRDYIIIKEYKDEDKTLQSSPTKLMTKNRFIKDELRWFYEILLGILGVRQTNNLANTKATVGFIRTDGTITKYEDIKEEIGNEIYNSFYGIMTPIISVAEKQGFVFKFGFKDNQVAGDGLTVRDGNRYNEAITYTNPQGKFKYLDFYILNDYTYDIASDSYPLKNLMIPNDINDDNPNLIGNDFVYFGTGNLKFQENSEDSLIVYKDSSTNINISYQLKVLNYENNLLIFGKDFFTQNYLMTNDRKHTYYMYVYNNGTKYGTFEDLKIKKGYYDSWSQDNYVNLFVSNDSEGDLRVILKFELPYAPNDYTSWAIGDENDNLILACNSDVTHFELISTHLRPNVREIGSTNIIYDNIISLSTNDDYQIIITGDMGESISLSVYDDYSIELESSGLGESISLSVNDDYSLSVSSQQGQSIKMAVDDTYIIIVGLGEDNVIQSLSVNDDYSLSYQVPKSETISLSVYDNYDLIYSL